MAAACLLPGLEDANHFRERQSVKFWRAYSPPSSPSELASRIARGLTGLRSGSERKRLALALGSCALHPRSLPPRPSLEALRQHSETAEVLLQDIACSRSSLYRASQPRSPLRERASTGLGERAAAERRSALVQLHEHVRGKPPKRLAIIDAGCGSGRLLRDMRLSHPSAAFTALDVSSSQLARAQREAEASGAEVRNSVDASSVGPVEYVQANAKHVPSPAAAFDIAVLSYVANELSGVKEREDVMAELARVLKPNGMLVVVSPLQVGDRPRLNQSHATYGPSDGDQPSAYSKHSLGALGRSVGLEPLYKEMRGQSKALNFRRMARRRG